MKVQIRKRRDGKYVVRSQELGNMALANERATLVKIAAGAGWEVVRAWK